MKPNELMIGDWVTSKKWGENPFKLTRINDSGRYCYGITSNGAQVGPFLIEEFEPIPLTLEILEKNGFYYDEDRKAYLMGVIFQVKLEKYGLFSFEICGCSYPLNTVHELQHALRLCGIEKEIIL